MFLNTVKAVIVVLIIFILNVHEADAWILGRRGLQQEGNGNATVTFSGPGIVKYNITTRTSTSSRISARLVNDAKDMFTAANAAFGGGRGTMNDEEFCPAAFKKVNASAQHFVTAVAQASATVIACADVQGEGFVVVEGTAEADSQAQDLAVVLLRAVAEANIGVNESRAEAVVEAAVSDFARAFATAESVVAVNGTGMICVESMNNVTVVVDAVVNTVILLVAEIDCKSSFASGIAEFSSEVITGDVTISNTRASNGTGTDVMISAGGSTNATVVETDGK